MLFERLSPMRRGLRQKRLVKSPSFDVVVRKTSPMRRGLQRRRCWPSSPREFSQRRTVFPIRISSLRLWLSGRLGATSSAGCNASGIYRWKGLLKEFFIGSCDGGINCFSGRIAFSKLLLQTSQVGSNSAWKFWIGIGGRAMKLVNLPLGIFSQTVCRLKTRPG